MEKVYMSAFGCPTNTAESESMKGMLKKSGFDSCDSEKDADVIIISICTVKGNASALREIRKSAKRNPGKKIVVSGCITADIIPEIRKIAPDASLISTHNISDIVDVVEETINGNPVDAVTVPEKPPMKHLLPEAVNGAVAIIPICNGCTGSCSYCSVRIVKGNLFSYPEKSLLKTARKAISKGCREIWITAQDTASYMLDTEEKTMLPELVKNICLIPGEFMVRIGMMNINNIIPVIDEMIEAMKDEKVFKFIHIPAQSGSDRILRLMERKYTSEEFVSAVKKLREAIPDITISTDIITGFPGESEDDFRMSIKLIENTKPDVLNISRFRPRKGTCASLMENQVDPAVAKQRSSRIASAFEWNSYSRNRSWVGWKGKAIVEEKGKEGTVTARNFAYKPIIVKGDFYPGKILNVRIDAYSKHDLRGFAC